MIWKILPLMLSLALANPHKNHNHDVKEPEIFSSQSNTHRQLRFIFVQGYATTTVTSGTSTLSTYPTCYSTQAGITTCSTSTITGRKKRSENPENVIRTQSTKVMLNNVEHDFAELIQATRASRHVEDEHLNNTTTTNQEPNIFEGTISDFPECVQNRVFEDEPVAEGRLITVTTTVTSTVAATATVQVAATQSLVFSSAAAFCLPSSLLSSLSISACYPNMR